MMKVARLTIFGLLAIATVAFADQDGFVVAINRKPVAIGRGAKLVRELEYARLKAQELMGRSIPENSLAVDEGINVELELDWVAQPEFWRWVNGSLRFGGDPKTVISLESPSGDAVYFNPKEISIDKMSVPGWGQGGGGGGGSAGGPVLRTRTKGTHKVRIEPNGTIHPHSKLKAVEFAIKEQGVKRSIPISGIDPFEVSTRQIATAEGPRYQIEPGRLVIYTDAASAAFFLAWYEQTRKYIDMDDDGDGIRNGEDEDCDGAAVERACVVSYLTDPGVGMGMAVQGLGIVSVNQEGRVWRVVMKAENSDYHTDPYVETTQ